METQTTKPNPITSLNKIPKPEKINPNFFREVCDQSNMDPALTERYLDQMNIPNKK